MRWKQDDIKEGTKRTIKKYALTPIQCENGDGAWAETVEVEQEYRCGLGWVNIRIINH